MYSVLETRVVNGATIYSVAVMDQAMGDWIRATFVEGKDYTSVGNLKGVWYDLTEEAMTLLRLKF